MNEVRPANTDRRGTLDDFRWVERGMPVVRVCERCGLPDRYAGSGLVILVYDLSDGTQVRVGSNGSTVLSVDHWASGRPDVRLVYAPSGTVRHRRAFSTWSMTHRVASS
jgi:hypothetical protein